MIRNAKDRPVNLAIHGAGGRMGRRLIALASEDAQLKIVAAIESSGSPLLGQDAGLLAGIPSLGVSLTDRLPQQPGEADVVIDFSVPIVTRSVIQRCVQANVALVVGTTGLSAEDHKTIDAAAATIPVLQSANMSLGVNLLIKLVAQAAKVLGPAYDIEITETHHRFKKDAPSGTALALAKSICDATGKEMNKTLVHGRSGNDVPRQPGTIGMHALRLGDVVGDHSVHYSTPGERVELSHYATSRDVFVRGALHAGKWLADQRPGRYAMADALGL